jgi:putative ABC transport system permease protein
MNIGPLSGGNQPPDVNPRHSPSIWLGQFIDDLRFSIRSLRRARGFSLTVLFTLILGIGVTTLVYEITAWIIFRESPFPRSEELFFVGSKDKKGVSQYFNPGFYFQAYQEQTSVFQEYAAVEHPVSNIVLAGQPIPESVVNVSRDCLHTLDIRPVMGRGFLPDEFGAGKNNVVVITDLLWRKFFNAAPDVLGKQLTIDKQVCTIVGVFGQLQQFPANFGGTIYRPLVFRLLPGREDVFSPSLVIIGRLKPGITRENALAELKIVKPPPLPQWASAFFADQTTTLTNITELNRPDVWWVMLAAAVFLYAIACLNTMNLMLIRLLDRRHEFSIRFAVGGSRWQVTQIVAIESLLLSLMAWMVVTIFVRWGFPPIFALLNGDDSSAYMNYWDWRTLLCVGGLSVIACLAATAAPASRLLRTDIYSGLKEGGPSMGESRRAGRIRNLFVVLQATFAVILLTGTGLMVRSFQELRKVDLGFDPVGKVKVWVLPPAGYELKPEARLELFERLKKRLSLLPGVRAASYAQDSLLMGQFWGTAQLKMADGTYQPTAGNFVSSDFQQTAGLTMKEGKWLSDNRNVGQVVISETLARTRFGDRDPVGQFVQIQVSGDAKYPVVGVVKDVKDSMRASPGMRIYFPAWYYPPNVDTLLLRLDRDPPKEFAGLVRRAVYEVDPNLVTTDVRSINQQVIDTMSVEHYAYTVLRGLAAIALALTVVGIFSVIAFTVDCRMTEFGVRLALGATPSDLNYLVIRRGIAAAAAGIAIGLAGALGLTRFMKSMLYGTTSFDPIVYAAVAGVLLVAAIAACWLPARRAARVDVARLLKSE